MKDTTIRAEDIIKEWRDYEGNIVQLKNEFDEAVKKTQKKQKNE